MRVIPILVIGLGLLWGAHTSSTWAYESANAPADSSGNVPPIGPLIFTQVPIEAHQISGAPSQRHAPRGGWPTRAAGWPTRTAGWPTRAAGLTGSAGANRLPDGSRIVSFDSTAPANGTTLLTASFHTAGRPDLSFDGRRIIFVGKRAAADPLDVWEMNVDGSELRRITQSVGNCTSAIYLPTIYTIDAEEPFYQIAFCSDAGSGVGSAFGPALYTCRMDGTRIRRITFNPYGASDPFLISDGRLLFSSWRAPAPEGKRDTALFTINTDGTDIFVFADAHGTPAVRGMPCETPAEQVVYVESTSSPGWDRGGALISVSRKRSLHTRRVLASSPDGGAGFYLSPSAAADDTMLVSYRGRDTRSYGLYLLDMADGTRILEIYDDAQWHDIDAVQVRPRPMPAGRSSVVSSREETGLLYGLNAYLSNTKRSHGINHGRIHSIRVIEALDHSAGAPLAARPPVSLPGRPALAGKPPVAPPHSRAAANPDTIGEQELGTVPVESDGSFYMEVPARTPLRLQTLDADGAVLQTMRSWIWVMPAEARGCIGCHADRELTPPNRHVLALRKPPHWIGRPPVGHSKSESSGNATAPRQDQGEPQ